MNNKNSKLKHLIIILAVILAIAVALIGVNTLFHKTSTSIRQDDIDPDSLYFMYLEKECAKMTIEQRLKHIQYAEAVLEQINSEINSDSLNPEERFEARLSVNYIKRELEILKKYLPEEKQ